VQQPVIARALPIYSNKLSNAALLANLYKNYPEYTENGLLLINIFQQHLFHIRGEDLIRAYSISSAANGTGNNQDSGKTPLGAHYIKEKYGDSAPLGSQFKARKLTGYIPKILTSPQELSCGDNITSRILWLSGLEAGFNLGDGVDSYSRYIYIHGTDEEGRLGTPVSHGCIRMANQDIINLYDEIGLSTLVYIYQQ